MCMTKDELDKMVAKRRKLTATKKKIDERLKAVDAEIIEYAKAKGALGGQNGTTLIVFGDGYKISYQTNIKHPLDKDALEKLLGAELEKYKKVSVESKLVIN